MSRSALYPSPQAASLAAVPALALLWLTRSRRPNRREWPGVILAALGIVVGWPLASTLAMRDRGIISRRGVQWPVAAVHGRLHGLAQR